MAGFPVEAFARMTQGRYVSLPRGDLAAAIFGRIEGKVETIFGDSVKLSSRRKKVFTSLSNAGARATSISSSARTGCILVSANSFLARKADLRSIWVTKSRLSRPRATGRRDELVYVMYTEVGQQVGRFAMRDDRTMFLFIFRDDDMTGVEDLQAQKALLRKRFGDSGWECPQILDALDATEDLYFDRVSQIRMDPATGMWTRGRVTLLGDAAFCVSFLAGQGSALAMVAAYILAGELHRANGDYASSFRAVPEFVRAIRSRQARGCTTFCGCICAEVEIWSVSA